MKYKRIYVFYAIAGVRCGLIYAKYRREMYMPSWCHPLKEKSCLSSFLSVILDTVGLNIPAWVKSASVFVILFAKAMSYQLSLNLKENI